MLWVISWRIVAIGATSVIAGISGAITVCILLKGIRNEGTIVYGIWDAIGVLILGASVACAVLVCVLLLRIIDPWAIIDVIGHFVFVLVDDGPVTIIAAVVVIVGLASVAHIVAVGVFLDGVIVFGEIGRAHV